MYCKKQALSAEAAENFNAKLTAICIDRSGDRRPYNAYVIGAAQLQGKKF